MYIKRERRKKIEIDNKAQNFMAQDGARSIVSSRACYFGVLEGKGRHEDLRGRELV